MLRYRHVERNVQKGIIDARFITAADTYRKVSGRLTDTVSVKDFGAVGNGVTDDSAAFQRGVDATSAAGKTLFVPAGTYAIEREVALRAGTSIVGDGQLSRVLYIGGTSFVTHWYAAFFAQDVNDIYIANLRIDQDTTSQVRNDVSLPAKPDWPSAIILDNVTECEIAHCWFDGGAPSVWLFHVNKCKVVHCDFVGTHASRLQIEDASVNVLVAHCNFGGGEYQAIDVEDTYQLGDGANRFPLRLGNPPHAFTNMVVANNLILNSGDQGINLMNVSNATVVGNMVFDAGTNSGGTAGFQQGIRLFTCMDVTVVGNTCQDGGGEGIQVRGASHDVLIVGNSTQGNTTCGLDLNYTEATLYNVVSVANRFNDTTPIQGATRCLCEYEFYNAKRVVGSVIPSDGASPHVGSAFLQGAICMNSAPASAGYIGWVCTVAGTPGTWKGWGVIA